jgi:hypothetical protein
VDEKMMEDFLKGDYTMDEIKEVIGAQNSDLSSSNISSLIDWLSLWGIQILLQLLNPNQWDSSTQNQWDSTLLLEG